jgi:predicted phage replisome organizer
MAEVKWIKLLTEMFDDEKIKLIEAVPEADMILVIWIKLLTLAGKKNMNGYIFLTENIPYTDEMLATLFNRPINTVRLALETFKNFGMINYNGEGQIKITNWEKHQNIEGLERIKELARARQSKYIERKKQKALTNNDVSTTLNDDTRQDQIRLEEHKKDVVCVSPVETVETVDNSSKEKEKLLKKEMLDLVSGCFKESFLDGLFKKYPVEKIEKYFEELKYLQNIRSPVGWLVTQLKNDLDKGG